MGSPPTNQSSSHKTRLNDLSHGIKIWTDFSFVLSQCTRLTDGRTDRILIARPRLHSLQRGKKLLVEDRPILSASEMYRSPKNVAFSSVFVYGDK